MTEIQVPCLNNRSQTVRICSVFEESEFLVSLLLMNFLEWLKGLRETLTYIKDITDEGEYASA
jgi:hypothetical protein